MEQTKSVFTREFFERREAGGACLANRFSSLACYAQVQRLSSRYLSSHSAVEGTGELPDLIAIVEGFQARHPDLDYAGMLGELNGNDLRISGEQYIQSHASAEEIGRPHFTDKAPLNFLYVGSSI